MSGDQRPGGWVNGIGWVARLCDLDPYDIAHETEEGPQEADLVQMWTAHDRLQQVVIVTRWADGTTPTAPSGEHGDTVSVPEAEWDALVEAVDKGAGRMGHRWIVPIGDRATALVGASRRQAATEGGAS